MTTHFMLGWEEWLAMPDIGLPAIKAKIDTGARTSALHAFMIQEIGGADRPRVRFGIHPIPGRDDVAVIAEADVVDRREVTSSNGERELRWVIRTRVAMGGREWPIDVTLANRETMAYRMLLGRQAILDDMLVDATSSFHQPRLDDGVYSPKPRDPEPNRPLTIGLLTRRPENTTNRRFVRTAERRGHTVVIVDRTRVSLWIDAREPALFVDGRPIAKLDAAVIRVGRTIGNLTLGVARQMELIGAYCVPTAAALSLLGDPLAMRQALARHRIAIPEVAVSHSDFVGGGRSENPVLADSLGPLRTGALLRFAVVGGRALGAIERPAATALEPEPRWQAIETGTDTRDARALAETAAKSLGIGLAAIDVANTRQGPIIVEVSAGLAVAEFERLAGVAIIEALIVHIEQEARSRAAARL